MEPNSVANTDVTIVPSIDPIDIGLDSSEKGNTNLTAKPRKETTSVYLKYFETAPDRKTRNCKFCGRGYSIATSTGNLRLHLSNVHPGYDKVEDLSKNPTSNPQPLTVVKKPQPQVKTTQSELDRLNWLLIKWLILASLPPSAVQEKWLVKSFKFLNPSIQLWPEERYLAGLRKVFRSMQENVRLIVDQVSSILSITLGMWNSYEEIFYMSVTCQWIDENWSFQKVLLDVCHVPEPRQSSEIYHSLLKVLKFYNIQNRVLSCTTESDVMRACQTLQDDINGQQMGPSFCYVPCAAYTLNSIIDDGLKYTVATISKIREFVMEMNTSSKISEDFMQFTTTYNEGNWKFPLDVSARWSGNYQMLDIAHKAGKSMETVIRTYEEQLGSRMLLSTIEKKAVHIVHEFLEPFYKTINDLCTTKVLTTGLVLFFMDNILEMIAVCRESRDTPDWLKKAAEIMTKKAHRYNDQICNVFTYRTAILDPRIKVELLPDNLKSEKYLKETRAYFMRNYSTSHAQSAQELEDGGTLSFAEEIARKRRRASMSSATDELTQYLSEPAAHLSTDVLEWWKVNSSLYPRLSLMARDFLAIQATAIAPEDLFCSKGDEIQRQRYSLPHDSTQPLHCLRSWMQGGMKLKCKSTEIDYESLMELAAAAEAASSSTVSDKKQE